MYGMAFDIGTTTLAASLVDTGTGARLALAGAANPQREYGADVLTRLDAACRSPELLRRLSLLLNEELQRMAAELLRQASVDLPVRAMALAGNPAMEHLLLGLPVDSLARIPYRPLFTGSRRINTSDLGWQTERDAFVFPLPGGFVGGDLIAFLYGAGINCPRSPLPGPRLFLDIGTNAEIALSAGGKILATSAAAGPAFEGGNLTCGMPAVPGAISGVTFSGGRVAVTTIGDAPAAGICGSAVIEAMAWLLSAGVVDATGRLLPPSEVSSNLAVRVREVAGQPAFILHQDAERLVYLSQEDIRQLQLAKAAIRAGIELLEERAGLDTYPLQEIVVTGSFGAQLRQDHLLILGILPGGTGKVRFVREGALAGVERMLCMPNGPAEVDELAAQCRVVPLSGNPAFEQRFLANMNFPAPKPF